MMRWLVCVSRLCEQGLALGPEHRHIIASDEPDDAVVDMWVLMRELVAKVDDAAALGETREQRRVEESERRGGFADGDELTLHGRAQESTGAVLVELHAREREADGLAGV